MTVVVVQHTEKDPPGLLAEWLQARGQAWRTAHPGRLRLGDATAVVSLGSPAAAYEPEGWVPDHIESLRCAVRDEIPVLGLCFGAQALAIALGGSVSRAPEPEIGWVTPVTSHPELAGPWFAWHFDQLQPPIGSDTLARTPRAVQAFRTGPHLGVQFHPEITVEIAADWIRRDPTLVAEYGAPGLTEDIAATTESHLRTRAFVLFDWWGSHALPTPDAFSTTSRSRA